MNKQNVHDSAPRKDILTPGPTASPMEHMASLMHGYSITQSLTVVITYYL